MNTYVYGHPLIEKIVLRETYARVYMTTGNVYQVNADGEIFTGTQAQMHRIVATAIRKEKA